MTKCVRHRVKQALPLALLGLLVFCPPVVNKIETALVKLLAYANSLPLNANGVSHDFLEEIAYTIGLGDREYVHRRRHQYPGKTLSPVLVALGAGLATLVFIALVTLGLMAISSLAHAQQQVITQFGNGYAVAAPGQPPVMVQPFGNGYTVAQPGQAPTLVQPFGQGWITTPPLNGPIQPIQPIAPIPPMGGY